MERPFFIAEIGINHNGSLDIAKKLIDMALSCGFHAVKFQKRDIDTVYTKEFLDSPRESPWGTTQREQKMGLEFGKEEYDEIDRYCKEKGIHWFASAWDFKSLEFLKQYDLKYNKIASAMVTHYGFVDEVLKEGKHIFVSTGGTCGKVVTRVANKFIGANVPFTLMHCVSLYPCPDELCDIKMVWSYRSFYKCSVGYSGHEVGILPSVLAVAAGAEVVERHITLDRTMYGSDQAASLEKRGAELLIRDCKSATSILGDGYRNMTDKEKEVIKKLRYWDA